MQWPPQIFQTTPQILREFSILGLLNSWYDSTPITQKPHWNSVRRMKNYLHTLGNYTYGLNAFNVSIIFTHFRQKWNFVVVWKKSRNVPQIQWKNSCCVVGASTKEVSTKIRQSSSILWNYSVFIVINQSDRPESRKELHKTFWVNGLFWWNFICTTKMISRAYIALYL